MAQVFLYLLLRVGYLFLRESTQLLINVVLRVTQFLVNAVLGVTQFLVNVGVTQFLVNVGVTQLLVNVGVTQFLVNVGVTQFLMNTYFGVGLALTLRGNTVPYASIVLDSATTGQG